MKRVCISGYFGFDNIGDEAVLQTMIRSLKAEIEDLEIIVLSDNPAETAAEYGVTAYDRWRWIELHKAIRSADLLISGGGSLFQDITGKRSLFYYLHIIKMAMRRKKPVLIYSQGIGPIESAWGRKRTVKVLRKAKRITVRDEDSADTLKAWGFRRGRVKVTADPVLNIGDLEREVVLLEIEALSPADAARFRPVEPVAVEAETAEAETGEEAVPEIVAEETVSEIAIEEVAAKTEENADATAKVNEEEVAASAPEENNEKNAPVTDLEATIVLDDLRRIIAAKKAADVETSTTEEKVEVAEEPKAETAEHEEAKAANTAVEVEIEETAANTENSPAEALAQAEQAPIAAISGEETAEISAEEKTEEKTEAKSEESTAEEPTEKIGDEAGTETITETIKEENAPTEAVDPAIEVAAKAEENTAVALTENGKIPLAALKGEGERLAAFCVRQWDGFPLDDIALLGDYLIEQGYRLVFLPFQYPDDNRAEKEIIAKIQGPVLEVDRNLNAAQMLYCLDQVDFMFGMRLHALIMAAALKIPFASLSYDPKIDGFVKSIGLKVTGSVANYDSDEFIKNFKSDLAKQEEIRAIIEENLPGLQEKAEEATGYVKELLARVR